MFHTIISPSCLGPQTITGTSTRITCIASSRASRRTTSRSCRASSPPSCSSSTATWSWSRCTCSTPPWLLPTPASVPTRCVPAGRPGRPGACGEGEAGAPQEADTGSYSTRLPAPQRQRRPEPQRLPPDPPADLVTPHPLSAPSPPRTEPRPFPSHTTPTGPSDPREPLQRRGCSPHLVPWLLVGLASESLSSEAADLPISPLTPLADPSPQPLTPGQPPVHVAPPAAQTREAGGVSGAPLSAPPAPCVW